VEITISGRHLEITPAIRQHAEEKANKLPKFYDLIQEIDIVLDGSEAKAKRAEVVVIAEHKNKFVAHHEGEDLYGCIDQAFHKVQHQISAHKERFRNRKHSGE
jgi:putative sigma-54 modulation protein